MKEHKMANENLFLYKPIERKFSDLYFCYCGYEACAPLHSFGPAVRPNYLIHFIMDGKGIFTIDNTTYQLGAGEGFIIEPGKQTFYQADAKEPWTYFWIGFDGTLAKDMLSKMGLGQTHLIFRCNNGEEMRDIIFDMLKYNRANDADEFMIEALLYRLFSSMMKGAAAGIPGTVKGNEYVRKAIEFIQNNYARPIHVKDVADYVNINRGYLYSLFKSETNMSPQEYLSNLRLTRAAEQLNTTNYSIEVIATSNGYGDPVVFTKAFKKMHGISPSKYRQTTVERSRKSLEE